MLSKYNYWNYLSVIAYILTMINNELGCSGKWDLNYNSCDNYFFNYWMIKYFNIFMRLFGEILYF